MDIRKYLSTSKQPAEKSVVETEDDSDDSADESSSDDSSKATSDAETEEKPAKNKPFPDEFPVSPKKLKDKGEKAGEGPPAKKRKSSTGVSDGAFPTSKLRTIMKSVPSLESVGLESLAVINKATEMFTTFLCVKGYEEAAKRKSKCLEYDDLAALVNRDPKLQWIHDVLTERISYAEYLARPKQEDDYDVL